MIPDTLRISKRLQAKGESPEIADEIASILGEQTLPADVATKADLANLATKAELAVLATKAELANLATKAELANLATKAELAVLATKAELAAAVAPLATKAELAAAVAPLATKAELVAAVAPLATKAELHQMENRLLRWTIGTGIAAVMTLIGTFYTIARVLPPFPSIH